MCLMFIFSAKRRVEKTGNGTREVDRKTQGKHTEMFKCHKNVVSRKSKWRCT